MGQTILYDHLSDCFESIDRPDWYSEAVRYLRGDKDQGLFGLYLYNLIKSREDITEVINIGTARGHSAVCAAKAMDAVDRTGTVHTIDIIDPEEQRKWHTSGPSSDPMRNGTYSMRELIGRFHDQCDQGVSIEFHIGDSNIVIPRLDVSPDLVFHDGLHTYRAVRRDIKAANELTDERPIHVFDDCYLFEDEWTFRPFSSKIWYDMDRTPKIGRVVRALRTLSISRKQFPGLTMAVKAETEAANWKTVEIIDDADHAPITAIFPP